MIKNNSNFITINYNIEKTEKNTRLNMYVYILLPVDSNCT